MRPPEQDIEGRLPIWDALHYLWLDTDVEALHLEHTAKTCAESSYNLTEIEAIYWNEVYPFMRFNLYPWSVAGEWAFVDTDVLREGILKHHKFGKRLWFKRRRTYAYEMWSSLITVIRKHRE
ncbi:MAG: DUF7079 family protein [Maricaulaceae bacterium]